ncbi:hypothetical protein HGRIS_004509 [Hohenbuehelia grisea]|uniref:Uncharacterized protein n=1 Tax=Hohenbuehelia grisea TaxID=104357 RepID=A0ABR3JC90_9AGAR
MHFPEYPSSQTSMEYKTDQRMFLDIPPRNLTSLHAILRSYALTMDRSHSLPQLSSLSEWSAQHIRDVFEAPSDDAAIRAVENTFSEDLEATINGQPLKRDNIKQLVIAMRQDAPSGLKVHWHRAVEVPREPSTPRDGSFGGSYVISGIRRQIPGTSQYGEFERHKTVTVRIQSQSSDPTFDSRRIVNLTFVASDIRVDRQAML